LVYPYPYVPVRASPYTEEEVLWHLSKGAEVAVVKKVRNTRNNWWFLLDDGYYIYSANIERVVYPL